MSGMMMYDGNWMGGAGMVIFGAAFLFFWILVFAALVALVRFLWRGGDAVGRSGPRGDALAILEERYARGEIDREEFLRRKQDLR
jgi:putative membrane protein